MPEETPLFRVVKNGRVEYYWTYVKECSSLLIGVWLVIQLLSRIFYKIVFGKMTPIPIRQTLIHGKQKKNNNLKINWKNKGHKITQRRKENAWERNKTIWRR